MSRIFHISRSAVFLTMISMGVLFHSIDCFSQNLKSFTDSDLSNHRFLSEIRFGNLLGKIDFLYIKKATRFMPILTNNSLGTWTSPSTEYSMFNMPFADAPLNFSTPDILPFDQIHLSPTSIGKLKNISDNSIMLPGKLDGQDTGFKYRIFMGSETGDPLIFVYTKPDQLFINKNKIAPSAVFSFSNRRKNFVYKITAGYLGTFSTSPTNSEMISYLGHYYFGKLNKQFFVTAGINYKMKDNRGLKLYSGFMSYYGWDVTPFLSSFTHFETYMSTVRGEFTNLLPNVSIAFRWDRNLGKINKTPLIQPAEFLISEYSAKPYWEISKFVFNDGFVKFKLFAEITFHSISNFKEDVPNGYQNYFTDEISKLSFITGSIIYFSSGNWGGEAEIYFSRNYTDLSSFAGSILLYNDLNKYNKLEFTAASKVRYPNVNELYGNYTFNRDTRLGSFDYKIQGDQNLHFERLNNISFSYIYQHVSFVKSIGLKVYFRNIQNPLRQTSSKIERLSFPNDILRSAVYENGSKKNIFGTDILFELQAAKIFSINGKLKFAENSMHKETPRYFSNLSAVYVLPFSAFISLIWEYSSKTIWEDYVVSPENDFYNAKGVIGVVPEYSKFDLNFEYALNNLFFFKTWKISFSVFNIFNREVKYHPLGNRLDRAVILKLTGRI